MGVGYGSRIPCFFSVRFQPVQLKQRKRLSSSRFLLLYGGWLDTTSIDGALNAPGAFTGEVANQENVGKSSADLKQLWNAARPDDLIP